MIIQEKESTITYATIVLVSTLISLFLFFMNPTLSAAFDSSKENIEWYAVFSQTIFEPNTFYIAESILLPLLAKVIHANGTTVAYRLLCGFLTISVLPILSVCYHIQHKNIFKTFFFTVIFALSFKYLYDFRLGFPDPITIILIAIATLTKRPALIFVASFLATLSHFSMSLVAFVLLALAHLAQPRGDQTATLKHISLTALGLIAGKLFIYLWSFLFSYNLVTRTDWALEYGLTLFLNHYHASPTNFWLTPGIQFLLAYAAVTLFFIKRQNIIFSTALLGILGIAYLTNFFTVDGLRVFAVIIVGAYVFILSLFIETIYPSIQACSKRYQMAFNKNCVAIKEQALYISLGFPLTTLWLYVIDRCKSRGLLFNDPQLMATIGLTDRVMSGALLIAALGLLVVAITPHLREQRLLSRMAKIIFILPLTIILIQGTRHVFAPNESLSLLMKIFCAVVLILLPIFFSRLNLSRYVEAFRQHILLKI